MAATCNMKRLIHSSHMSSNYLGITTEYRANFLGIFVEVARRLASPFKYLMTEQLSISAAHQKEQEVKYTFLIL